MALGKFHGVMMPATPIGCLMNIICLELLTAGTTYLLGSYTNVEITYEKQSQTIRCKVRGACSIKQLTSPLILRASSANHSKKLFPYPTSPLASAKGFPCSAVKIFANSSELAWQRSNHFRNKAALSRAVVQRQVLKACKTKKL